MNTNCGSGQRTELEVEPAGDCTECVGIRSIKQNPDGTLIVTLTAGQSLTYQGKGDKGETGDKGENGGSGMFYNQYPNILTAGTGAFEILATTQLPANVLTNPQDQCIVRAIFQCGDVIFAPNASLNQEFKLTINGQKLGTYSGIFSDAQMNRVELLYRITRIDENNAVIDGALNVFVFFFGFVIALPPVVADLGALSGLNFAIPQTINMMAKTDIGEAIKVAGIHLYGEYKKINS